MIDRLGLCQGSAAAPGALWVGVAMAHGKPLALLAFGMFVLGTGLWLRVYICHLSPLLLCSHTKVHFLKGEEVAPWQEGVHRASGVKETWF